MERAVSFSLFCCWCLLLFTSFTFSPAMMYKLKVGVYIYIFQLLMDVLVLLLVVACSQLLGSSPLAPHVEWLVGFSIMHVLVHFQQFLLMDCLCSHAFSYGLNSYMESPFGRRCCSATGRHLGFNDLTFETSAARQQGFNCKVGRLGCFNVCALASLIGRLSQCLVATVSSHVAAADDEKPLLLDSPLSPLLGNLTLMLVCLTSLCMGAAQAKLFARVVADALLLFAVSSVRLHQLCFHDVPCCVFDVMSKWEHLLFSMYGLYVCLAVAPFVMVVIFVRALLLMYSLLLC